MKTDTAAGEQERETMEIRKTLLIDASPEVVFKAIIDPNEFTNWFPDQVILEPKVGGELQESTRKANKDPSKFSIYMVSYPKIVEAPPSSNQPRTPMSGTIDQIGSDIEQIKAMGTDHIIFGYLFSSVGTDMKKMIDVTMQLARFAK